MIAMLKPALPVLLGVVFLELGVSALSPVAGVQLVDRHVAASLIGFVSSAYYCGFLLGTLSADRAIDRVGHIRAFAVFATVAANLTLVHGLVESPYVWIVLRALIGYAMAGLFMVAESWLNSKATSETRGRTFATYMVASWAASGIGPLILNIGNPLSVDLFSVIAIAFATAVLPMALTSVGNPEIAQRSRFGIAKLIRISPLGVAACFSAGLVNSALYGMAPLYAESVGLDPAKLSILLSTAIMGGLVVQWPIGFLSDRFGRRPLMLASSFIAAVLALIIAIVGERSFPLLLGLIFAFSSMTAPFYALGVGQTNDYITSKDFVAASAGLLFAWAVGATAGPTAAAYIMGVVGGRGLFMYCAAVLGVIASFIVYRMLVRKALPPKLQTNFRPIAPSPKGGAHELDPRTDEEHPLEVAAPPPGAAA